MCYSLHVAVNICVNCSFYIYKTNQRMYNSNKHTKTLTQSNKQQLVHLAVVVMDNQCKGRPTIVKTTILVDDVKNTRVVQDTN